MEEHLKLDEIFKEYIPCDKRPTTPNSSRTMQFLAITKLARKIEQSGATILRCSVGKIKTPSGKTENVLGGWLAWTDDFSNVKYFQFDRNPFFPQYAYIEYYDDALIDDEHTKTKCRISTGLTDVSDILWEGIEPYVDSDENIDKLADNILKAMEWVGTLSYSCKDKFVATRDNFKQTIFNKTF